jgi:hypothetical protein
MSELDDYAKENDYSEEAIAGCRARGLSDEEIMMVIQRVVRIREALADGLVETVPLDDGTGWVRIRISEVPDFPPDDL